MDGVIVQLEVEWTLRHATMAVVVHEWDQSRKTNWHKLFPVDARLRIRGLEIDAPTFRTMEGIRQKCFPDAYDPGDQRGFDHL